MFEHLTNLTPTSGSKRCSRKATPILPHAANHAAVVECRSARGLMVYLCASCASYVHAEAWLIRMGVNSPSTGAIRTAARLLGSAGGYEPASAGAHRSKEEWYHLRDFEKKAIARRIKREVLGPQNEVQAIKTLFVARDACLDPECLQRGGKHSETCGLTYGEPFAERVKVEVG
jgi:hypothetical protein